ncbi:hypothetical protein LTR29_010080 [Friedmanniomyces endolithicus]|nr:hypothetical protein LTR29_010080 [Friedmanniomyces endolithicus]
MPRPTVRRQPSSLTRLDVLSVVLETPSLESRSPRDSLSPIDQQFRDYMYDRKGASPSVAPGNRELQTQQRRDHHATFSYPPHKHATASRTSSTTACSPRFPPVTRPYPPAYSKPAKPNGLTTVTSSELRRRLTSDGHTDKFCVTTAHVRRSKSRRKHTPNSALVVPMGNRPSSLNGSPGPDDNASLNSVVRRPIRILRKSSNNLLKRLDVKSPLPRPLTATSILVTSHGNFNASLDSFVEPAHCARESVIMLPSAATATTLVDGDAADQPLSASTTIKDGRCDGKSSYQAAVEDADEDFVDVPPPVPTHRSSALSPTIPAPSPLPEDSPHKYGLKDHMDTPEPEVEPPVDISINKARRRSSGLEIFTEAKTLQSASSFLNGLSTNRRRAESSQIRTSDTWPTTLTGSSSAHPSSHPSSRPSSRPTSRPTSTARHTHTQNTTNHDARRRGHNFKPNGFAFSRPLSLPQLHCYLSHSRLLVSGNRLAPVECAMCHMDDAGEHFSCCWCAVRMCRFCRGCLVEGGVGALRERVKVGERGVGSGEEGGSSTESLGVGLRRGRGRALV